MATFYYEMAIGNAGHSLAKFEYITRTGKYQYSASGEIKEDLVYKDLLICHPGLLVKRMAATICKRLHSGMKRFK